MSTKTFKTWNCSVILLGIALNIASPTFGNSIMDIINMERVEKLLAERRENASHGLEQGRKLLLQNSVDGDNFFLNNENDSDDEAKFEGRPEVSQLYSGNSRSSDSKKQKSWHLFTDPANPYLASDSRGQTVGQNFTGVLDVSSLLANIARVGIDKILKSEPNTQLITKKKFLKKDWCKTESILQKIREDGCIDRTILNRFCYGQCNSFYIPKNIPKTRNNRKKDDDEPEEDVFFKSCGFCKPKRASWIFVTLRCPNTAPQFIKKKVQRIKQCKCLAETV